MTMTYEKMYLVSEPEYLKARNVAPVDRVVETSDRAPSPDDRAPETPDRPPAPDDRAPETPPPVDRAPETPPPAPVDRQQQQIIIIKELKNNILRLIIKKT